MIVEITGESRFTAWIVHGPSVAASRAFCRPGLCLPRHQPLTLGATRTTVLCSGTAAVQARSQLVRSAYPGTVTPGMPPAGDPRAPVAVVLDANAMWNQWSLTGKAWEKLRAMVEQQRIALYVPEVVVQEVVRGRQHDANDLVHELAKIKLPRIEGLLRLGLPTDRKELTNHVQRLVADYDAGLRTRLGELRAAIVPIPQVSHQEVLTRAMERRRPFDAQGRNGYRDVLIWHSLLDVVERGHAGIVFVTNNTTDFCTGKPPSLQSELLEELAQVSPEAVAIVATTVNEVGTRVDEVDRRIADAIEGGELLVFEKPSDGDVLAALTRSIDVIVAGVDPPTPGRWGKDLSSGWQFRSILEEDPVDVVSIDLDDATLVCEPDGKDWAEFTARVQAEVTLDGFAYKSDVYTEEGIDVAVQDSDWNDHYMHVYERHNAELTFRLAVDFGGTAIEECWLEEVQEILNDDDPHPENQ